MRFIAYRNLVGVSHTESEAKAEAAEVMVRMSKFNAMAIRSQQIGLRLISVPDLFIKTFNDFR